MRFISTAVVLIALPVAALAAPASPPPQPAHSDNFNGFYAGVMAGYESINDNSSDVGQGSFSGLSFSNNASAAGANAGIFAGYGQRINHDYYLGAEAEADIDSAESKARITSGSSFIFSDAQHNYDYGASVRGGFFPVDNTLLYGRIGVVESQFKSKAVNDNANLTGLRFGLGSETAIAPNVTARLDWVYTAYDSHSYTDANQVAHDSPTSNTFRVGLAYSF